MGKQGERFPCFPGLVITVCLNIWFFCLRWAEICYFWNFEERANRANVSLFYQIGFNGLPEYYCTRYELESIAVRAVSCSCWGFQTCFCRGQSRIFQVKRRLREGIVYLGGCNCQPRQRNRDETSPSLLGDREGRARPGDRNTCVNKYDSKGNRFKLNYLQFLWG